ncbi:transposase [Streptomyces synnematoformans]|uniref:Transposase IS4-like domain-containing protein n=1 Tax=Streptomyces synnematoformans TaxID=415721 RepID=A0ABN2XEJ0_9ACTN
MGDGIHAVPSLADRRYLGDSAGHIGWEVLVDTTICRARRHAAGARKRGLPTQAGRVRRGWRPSRKTTHSAARVAARPPRLTWAVDASFHVLATVVTAGQRADAPVFTEVMDRIHVPRIGGGHPRTQPAHVLADRACSSRKNREYLRSRQIPHTIPEKRGQTGHRRRRGPAGGRPLGLQRERYKARHKAECRIGVLRQARSVATRYEKLAVRYGATIQLALPGQTL